MGKISIRDHSKNSGTLINNTFIDRHMAKANGEYVKVYLFLIRHLYDTNSGFSLSYIADFFEHTEKDILRALNYWKKIGLLSLEYGADGTISSICIGDALETPTDSYLEEQVLSVDSVIPTDLQQSLEPKPTAAFSQPNAPSVSRFTMSKKDFSQLIMIAEQYLGRTLSRTDTDAITFFHDQLGFSVDLIEYLLEYCVENNHKSMHYIQSVALAWADAKITSVNDAKSHSALYNKNCYSVLKAFGITGRGPVSSELSYIRKWSEDYRFSLDIILEACNRTMAGIHTPSFEYTDSILKNWLSGNVQHLKDILHLDTTFQNTKNEKKKFSQKASTPNKFNNAHNRSYDVDSLEAQLLKLK